MAATEEDEASDSQAASRDLLGNACFYFHVAIMLYIIGGWATPWHVALFIYLVFLPAVALQWLINKNACILNNLESLVRTGRWRDPNNREEGQWLLTLVRDVTGLAFTPAQMDAFTYCVLAVLWGIGLWHVLGW